MRIAIFGSEGSFTEEAANVYCRRQHILKPVFMYQETVEKVFQAISTDQVVGIIPISNTSGGAVEETIEAMSKHFFRPILIFEINIAQNLLSAKNTKPEDIDKIYSHPQALAQCRLYLAKNWLRVKKAPYANTASAARDLAAGKLGANSAVIASLKAAKLYDLVVIAKDIQDSRFNFTQFLVFDRATTKSA